MVMKTTSFGVVVSDTCAQAGTAANCRAAVLAMFLKLRFIWILDRGEFGLLALRRRPGGKPERSGDRDGPAFRSLYEYPLGHSAGRSILLRNRIAVGAIHHTG